MFCAVSGTTPKEPVVTPKGVLYERSVIVKAIEVRRSDDDDDDDDDDDECCARARLFGMEMRTTTAGEVWKETDEWGTRSRGCF